MKLKSLGRRMESMVLPLELIQLVKNSDFPRVELKSLGRRMESMVLPRFSSGVVLCHFLADHLTGHFLRHVIG